MKTTIGIDQSYSCTGIFIEEILEDKSSEKKQTDGAYDRAMYTLKD